MFCMRHHVLHVEAAAEDVEMSVLTTAAYDTVTSTLHSNILEDCRTAADACH